MCDLKRLRTEAGVTLGLLGALTGISYSTISRYESGHISLISSDVEILGRTLERIMKLRKMYPFIDFRSVIAVKALLEAQD